MYRAINFFSQEMNEMSRSTTKVMATNHNPMGMGVNLQFSVKFLDQLSKIMLTSTLIPHEVSPNLRKNTFCPQMAEIS